MIRTLYLALCITAYLRADVYEVETVTTHAPIATTYKYGSPVATTYRYGKAGNVRLKETGNFRNLHTIIWNQERQAAYELDHEAHEYWEPPKADSIAVFAAWIARPHVRNSGKSVDVYYQTIDTGERRDMLGHTTKHLRIQERHVAPQGACDSSSLREEDGWYIAYPQGELGSLGGIGRQLALRDFGSDETDVCRDTVLQHGVKPNPGLLVLQKQGAHTFEVITLSAAPLNKNLFEPPGNYKKVARLDHQSAPTWIDRLSWDCERLIGSLATWFQE